MTPVDTEAYRFLQEILDELEECRSEESVLKCLAHSLVRIRSIDSAGIYTEDSSTGSYILGPGYGLSKWFRKKYSSLTRRSRFRSMVEETQGLVPEAVSEKPLEGKSPNIFLKGFYPLWQRSCSRHVLMVGSSRSGQLNESSTETIHCIVSAANSAFTRLQAEEKARESSLGHSLLLESISDPMFALRGDMRLLFCNESFSNLVKYPDPVDSRPSFKEVAGRELFGILRDVLNDVINSGENATKTFDYGERTFSGIFNRTDLGVLALMKDITEYEKTKKKLKFREKFESLLVNIATDFIEMQGTALNLGIHDALLNIGVAIEVDRAYLFQFSDDLRTMSNTHEWCASNIQPQIDRLQNMKTSDYPWWMNRLNFHETIHIPRVSEIPPWAQAEKKMLEDRDIQSLVVIPIVHGNDLIGYLGFDSVNQERFWSEDIVDLLRIVGDAIGNALERNRMEKELMEMYRRAEKEAQVNAVLLKEVNHRVKNNLSEIIGLLYAQRRFSEESATYNDFIMNLISRIRGLATVHDMLSSSGWNPLELTELAREIVNRAITNVSKKKKLSSSISRSSITVNSNQAHALALIFNELVRNSIKHALRERESLKIKVRMRRDRAGRINLTYSDDGPGYPEEVLKLEKKNLGLDLIQNLIMKNLQGYLTLQNDGGATARINFSISPPEERTNG